jgi:hypothetical protein
VDGQEYALKKVKMSMLKEKEKHNSLNEVRLLASIEDEHIVAYKVTPICDSNYLENRRPSLMKSRRHCAL